MKDFKINPLTVMVKAAIKNSSLLLLLPMALVHAEQDTNVDEKKEIEIIEVSTGYSTVKKSDLTGAISTVALEEIVDLPSGNVMQNLQGRIPGLQITTNGNPNPGATVRVRGQGLGPLGNNDPLYIIDGVAVSANAASDLGAGGLDNSNRDPLSNINASDIETITVLKDASSTSIYGARGANGIIMITTKRGKSGKAKFEFSTQTGVSARAVNKYQSLNTSEFIELQRESDINAGFDPAAAVLRTPDSNVDTDWSEYGFRDWSAVTKRYNFSVSGGTDKINYRTSLGYMDQDGIAVGSGLERYNLGLNLNAKTSDISRIGGNVSLSRTRQATALAESAYFASPVLAPYLFRPTTEPYLANGLPNTVNPVTGGTSFIQDLYYDKEGSITDRILSSIYAELDIREDLTLRTQFGFDQSFFNYKSYSNPLNTSSPSGGGATRAYQEVYNWTLTSSLRWNKVFNEKHSFDAILAYEINKEGFDGFDVSVESFPNGILQNIGSGAIVSDHGSETEDSSLKSTFLNLNYEFDQKYNLNATVRRDASSRFGANNKWGTFWSIGANWVVSNEEFMQVDWVDLLKVKASYGIQGNLPDDRYDPYSVLINDSYNGSPTAFPSSTQGNPDLKWEEQNMLSAGLEFGLFNNRLFGEATYFIRDTKDLIFNQQIEGSNGFTLRPVNVGGFKNTGFELELSYKVFDKEDFSWIVSTNITQIENEVTALDPGTVGASGTKIREIGEAWDTFYLKKWAGVDTATGAPMWYDANGNITFNYASASREKVGKANADYFGSFSNTIKYKNFDLNAVFTFQEGNKIYNSTSRITNSDGAFYGFNQSREQLDRWQKPGDVSANPKRITGNGSQSNQRSTRWLEDGSYLRLRNLTFGYTLDQDVLGKTFLNNARIYLQGTNLLTFTNFNGDPEQSIAGTHWFVYPNAQTVSLGINLSF